MKELPYEQSHFCCDSCESVLVTSTPISESICPVCGGHIALMSVTTYDVKQPDYYGTTVSC